MKGENNAAMAENAWSHLQEIVDALTAAGNSVQPPGFHPTQGGWECDMTGPLDPDIAAASINADPRLTYQDDQLSCSHCWSAIIGSEAQARHHRAYQAARQQLTRHATSTDCDLSSDSVASLDARRNASGVEGDRAEVPGRS